MQKGPDLCMTQILSTALGDNCMSFDLMREKNVISHVSTVTNDNGTRHSGTVQAALPY